MYQPGFSVAAAYISRFNRIQELAALEVQAPVAVKTEEPKKKPDCYGVFCLTYDLKAEEETKSWKKLINIAVSGAAGMISNHLLFKLASGEVFGPDQPIALKLLGSNGVAMELEDSLFPLLREVSIGIDPYEVFQDAEWALLIGAKPRGPGMERAGLLDINGQIFAEQGKALNAVASRYRESDSCPGFLNAKINGVPVKEVIKDTKWLEEEFTEKVQKRGGVLIQKWGRSSAASTAVSIVDAIRSLVTPTPEGDWFSSGVYTTGNPYGIAEDIVFSMPCRSKGDGDYELVKDVIFDDYLWNRIKKTEAELLAEKKCVAHLTGEGIAVCDLPGDTMLPGEM
ncbi:hypothetical protein DH2020_028404 [Rehmannia glutinosa]|uniref:Malate dehydrogenase n=1 Tax=Rehmannia glutinosa TaxID=99300 RepID=A0ABR0VUR3_REHGL